MTQSPDIAFTQFTEMLDKLSRSALPLAARGTLNRMAYETRTRIVEKEMPRQFTLRNTFEKRSVTYKRSQNTFDIGQMESSTGQEAVRNFQRGDRPMTDLREQEFGESLGPRRGSKMMRTPTIRSRTGKNRSKPVARANRPARGNQWPGMNALEQKALGGKRKGFANSRNLSPAGRIKRAHAIAARHLSSDQMYVVPLSSKRGVLGAFRVINKKITLMHRIERKKRTLKPRKTLEPAYKRIVNTRAADIWEEQVDFRLKKEAAKILKLRV